MTAPEELVAKLKDDIKERWRTGTYMRELRDKAVGKTKSRKRTNNIYDPEYCAFYEGYNRGWVMALDGAEQHRTDDGGFYNDPTVIENIRAFESLKKEVLGELRKKIEKRYRMAKNGKTVAEQLWTQAFGTALEEIDFLIAKYTPKPEQQVETVFNKKLK